MTAFEIHVIRNAILKMLRQRDFLGYQLSHANGGMDDEQLEEIAQEYLGEITYTDADLVARLRVLRGLLGEALDPGAASTMLQCGINRLLEVWPQVEE